MPKRGDAFAILMLLLPFVITFVVLYLVLTVNKKMSSDDALSIALPSAFGVGLVFGMLTYFIPQ